jgi:hypothetical protein
MHVANITADTEFLDNFVRNKQNIIIAFARMEYHEIVYNWFLHLKKHGLDTRALLICLDRDLYEFAKRKNIPTIHVNQDAVVSSINTNPVKNAWKQPFHICQALVIEHITQKYNIDLIQLDVDMCVMKKDLVEQIYLEVEPDYDVCIYTNVKFSDLRQLEISASQNGGMILLWRPLFVKKFIDNIKKGSELNLDAPDTNSTLENIGEIFKIKGKKLHPFLFTNTTFWVVDDLRRVLTHVSYAVHFNMLRDVTKLNSDGLKDLVIQKVDLMKKYGLWLVNGG